MTAGETMRSPRLGDILISVTGIDPERIQRALEQQQRSGGRIAELLLIESAISPADLGRALAIQQNVPFVDLTDEPPDVGLLRGQDIFSYVKYACLPWRRENGQVVLATADPAVLGPGIAALGLPPETPYVVTGQRDITNSLQSRFREGLTHSAVRGLAEQRPDYSAQHVVSRTQGIVLLFLAALLGYALYSAPVYTLVAMNLVLSLWFLATTLFKLVLVERGLKAKFPPPEPVDPKMNDTLPVYTVLVPMYKEPEVLPLIAGALMGMEYPAHRLDIKLVLEEDDGETIAVARSLRLPACFEIIKVPPSLPRTKPKACNYALHFARGDYLVIYDAEDRPDVQQLRKVLNEFKRLPENFGCIQGRLNYFNPGENWITRMFTLEYSMLFDALLPGLFRLGLPIPLGGTSNHFKMSALRDVGGWDPYNVTEDADLGVRLAQIGYRVGVIDSTTLEEANCETGNWIRQQSRWIKGYMQTWLVHMRHPGHLLQSAGFTGFLSFHLLIGGTVINSLGALVFWAAFLVWALGRGDLIAPAFPPVLVILGTFNLLVCNAALVYVLMIVPIRRGLWSLVPWALTAPVYALLMSVAAYKALWQLVTNPFHWEKTRHGLSRTTKDALAANAAAFSEQKETN